MKFKFLKYLFLLKIALLPVYSFGSSMSTDSLFLRANAYYAKAQYNAALDTYKKIAAGNERSAALYYNMGNASYKLEDLSSALLYYEKAHQLSPGDEDITANIKFVNAKTRDKIAELPEFFVISWWRAVFLSFSANGFALFSVIFMLAGSAMLILYFFAHERTVKKMAFIIAVCLFVSGLTATFLWSQQRSYMKNHKYGIVFSSSLYIKSAPAEQAKNLFLIHDGLKVRILESNNDWLRIRLANGNEGWLKNSDLQHI